MPELQHVGDMYNTGDFDGYIGSESCCSEEPGITNPSEEKVVSLLGIDSSYCREGIRSSDTVTRTSPGSCTELGGDPSASLQPLTQTTQLLSNKQEEMDYCCYDEHTTLPELSGNLFSEVCSNSSSSNFVDHDYYSSEWLKEYLKQLVNSDVDDACIDNISAYNHTDLKTDCIDKSLFEMIDKYLGDTCIDSLKAHGFFNEESESHVLDKIGSAASINTLSTIDSSGLNCHFNEKDEFRYIGRINAITENPTTIAENSPLITNVSENIAPLNFSEKYISCWNPKSAAVYYYCPYDAILRDTSFYDKEFEDCILGEIGYLFSKNRSNSAREAKAIAANNTPQFIIPDLTGTFSSAKKYILGKINEYALNDKEPEDIVIVEGMSMADIRNLLFLSIDALLVKLDGYCKKLAENITDEDAIGVVQTKIKVNVNGVRVSVDMRSRKSFSEQLPINAKKMIIKCATALREKFYPAVASASNILIKNWMFSRCHNVYFCNKDLKEISDICISIREIIAKDEILYNNVDIIAKKIVNSESNSNSVVRLHKLKKGSYVSNYISILSQKSIDKIKVSLERALVLCDEKVLSLDKKSSEKIAKYIVRDIETLSMGEYRRLCENRSKVM